ncbi:unnamed protein product, partial [Phaeothamnion confervicola]
TTIGPPERPGYLSRPAPFDPRDAMPRDGMYYSPPNPMARTMQMHGSGPFATPLGDRSGRPHGDNERSSAAAPVRGMAPPVDASWLRPQYPPTHGKRLYHPLQDAGVLEAVISGLQVLRSHSGDGGDGGTIAGGSPARRSHCAKVLMLHSIAAMAAWERRARIALDDEVPLEAINRLTTEGRGWHHWTNSGREAAKGGGDDDNAGDAGDRSAAAGDYRGAELRSGNSSDVRRSDQRGQRPAVERCFFLGGPSRHGTSSVTAVAAPRGEHFDGNAGGGASTSHGVGGCSGSSGGGGSDTSHIVTGGKSAGAARVTAFRKRPPLPSAPNVLPPSGVAAVLGAPGGGYGDGYGARRQSVGVAHDDRFRWAPEAVGAAAPLPPPPLRRVPSGPPAMGDAAAASPVTARPGLLHVSSRPQKRRTTKPGRSRSRSGDPCRSIGGDDVNGSH